MPFYLMVSKRQAIVRTIDELISLLSELPSLPQVIAIDGVTLAGKSTLGARLASRLRGTHLDLDDFVERDRGVFVAALRASSLLDAMKRSSSPLVICGICSLAAQQKAGIEGAFQIYLKRITMTGWMDGEEVYGNLLDEIATAYGKNPKDYRPAFEVREYHRQYRPDECADVVFERLE